MLRRSGLRTSSTIHSIKLLSALTALCLCCTRKGGKKLSMIRCHGGLGRPSIPKGQVDISIISRSSYIFKWKIIGATHALEVQWGPRRICCFHSRHNGSERRGSGSGAMTGPSSLVSPNPAEIHRDIGRIGTIFIAYRKEPHFKNPHQKSVYTKSQIAQ